MCVQVELTLFNTQVLLYMRKPLIAGNWKMHGTTAFTRDLLASIIAQVQNVTKADFIVFPPFTYLAEAQKLLAQTPICWGAQTVSDLPDGALTGEISTRMLIDLGCRYVLVGHSERRHILGESSELIARKVKASLESGLTPILCVGETIAQRKADKTLEIIQEQLAHVFRFKDNLPALTSLIIAYEPVWAIGTGHTATPEQADEVHAAIRSYCDQEVLGMGEQVRILYGGSVKPENAAGLSVMPNVDGALVGGASLKAEQFIEIGKQWNK